MAATNFGLMFLVSLLMGGVSDLLDVIPTDEYWRIKNVQVTEQVITAELAAAPKAGDIAPFIEDLSSPEPAAREKAAAAIRAMGPDVIPQLKKATEADEPEMAARARRIITEIQTGGKAQHVRKLMAIRTAGEKKMQTLLPRLNELTKSDEMFIAEYASAAIAAIEGKPWKRPVPEAQDNVWKLPADVRAVFHISVQGQKVATMEDVKNITGAAAGPDAEAKAKSVDETMRKLIEFADQTGNVRIEGITMGLSSDVGNKSGYMIFMIDGQYDRVAVANVLGKFAEGKSRAVGGIDVVDFSPEFSSMFPSNRQLVMVGGPKESPKPLEAIAEAFKGNQSPLKQSPEMSKLLGSIDRKTPLWGAMHVTEAYRQAQVVAPLENLTLSGTSKGSAISFRFDAKGHNAEGTNRAVGMVTNGVAQGKAMLQQIAPMGQDQPGLKQLLETLNKLLASVEVKIDATDPIKASMTGTIDAPPQLMAGILMGFASVAPPPPEMPLAPAREEIKPARQE